MKNKNSIILRIICFIICIATLTAGLWPFNFRPENKVEWLSDRNGVRFYGQAIAYSPDFFGAQCTTLAPRSLTIELWLLPGSEPSRYVSRILSFYDGSKNEGFFIGQWRSHLILRSAAYPATYQEKGLSAALPKNMERFITIVSGAEGTLVYCNGVLTGNYPGFNLLAKAVRVPGQLLLGNSPTGRHYWSGNLYGLSFYVRELSAEEVTRSYHAWTQRGTPSHPKDKGPCARYLFDEGGGTISRNNAGPYSHIIFPEIFKPLQRTILTAPVITLSWSYLQDFMINLFGFVPFGFFFYALFSKSRNREALHLTLTALLGGGVSLAIEIAQVFLPTRSSSLTDVLVNSIGTIIGALLFRYIHTSYSRTS